MNKTAYAFFALAIAITLGMGIDLFEGSIVKSVSAQPDFDRPGSSCGANPGYSHGEPFDHPCGPPK